MATLSRPKATFERLRAALTQPQSLRARMTIAAVLIVASVLTIVWILLGVIFENHIELLLEDDLESRLLELAGAITLDGADRPALAREPADPRYQRPAGGAYWYVVEDGKTVLRSLSLWDGDIAPSATRHLSPTGMATEALGPNGSTVYLAERAVTLGGAERPHRVQIAVALDTANVERLQSSFMRQVVAALGVIGVVLSLGTWLQSSYGLRPLRRLRDQLLAVRGGGQPRMEGQFPREVAPLIEDLNALLERQEDLVRRARERAGDLAHGLKTPLTILQIEARNAERRGEAELAGRLREQIEAMTSHIERELSRARMSGATAGGGALADAQGTVDRLIRMMQRMPRGDAIDWRNDLPEGSRLRMDPDDFGEIVGNLLDNGRKYAKSTVRISAQAEGGATSILIDDDGAGISRADRLHILQRGQRASDVSDGSGLGLSIVMESLAQYGLTLTIGESPSGGLRVSFPAPGWIVGAQLAPSPV